MSLITKDTFGVCAFAYAGGNRYYNQRIELGLIKFVDFYLLSLAYMSLSKFANEQSPEEKENRRVHVRKG